MGRWGPLSLRAFAVTVRRPPRLPRLPHLPRLPRLPRPL